MSKSTTDAYQIVTNRILEALDAGIVPWRKPWSLPAGMRPISIRGHIYTGINALVLGLSGYSDPRWLTFGKATEIGGNVRKGEKSTPAVFLKVVNRKADPDDDNEKPGKYHLLKKYALFNAEQCEGLDLPTIHIVPIKDFDPIAQAEGIIQGMPNRPAISHDGGDRAFYVPRLDSIHLPPRYAFENAGEYYSTALHELGHSTGHPKRLDRKDLKELAAFGSETYSKEELVAEFTSAFLCHEAGIEQTIENSAAYIRGWSRKLKADKRLVIQAASQGQRAADYILDRQAALQVAA